ncbi:MAG TPA: thioredoxin domain-containing protein [Candidatus Dormibacteraeota bacterium]
MPNRLARATSPYLLQHAANPVDWYEWGPEPLERARREDRPILLSVGYAACHWCHVMAHESFENPATAELMNQNYVCIKVDREERPDVDAVYMDAVQAMTGQGGWPMTVFLTPDLQPFYAGTYFPPNDRHGLPGFPRLLLALAEAWRERRGEVVAQGRQVAETIARSAAAGASADPLVEGLLSGAVRALEQNFDREWGGFSSAPKFPQPMLLELLLRGHLRRYSEALAMASTTLDRMAAGGIYDQLGGGFHRYSTDRRWLVPHFEKMLYDNAQLAHVYLHAWQLTRREPYRRVVRETLDYLLREMRHAEGGFFSAQDADSEGVEGKFFVWPYERLADARVAEWFGAEPHGNWEGANILWHPQGLDAADASRPEPGVLAELFQERSRRVRPATDDKVLAAWNGLAIAAFAEAGRVLGEPRYVEAAVAAAEFVLRRMRVGGRLQRAWREERCSGPGYLDDQMSTAAACLALWETTFEPRWIEAALELAREGVRLFAGERGGFFQTGSDTEAPLVRPKDLFDNAVPSGNSLAADVLQRLALLTGDGELERAGVGALRAVRALVERAPTGFGTALGALDLYLGPTRELAVVGEEPQRRPLLATAWAEFRPRLVLAAARPGEAPVALLEGREPRDGVAAYVCEHFACRLPVTTPDELAQQLA